MVALGPPVPLAPPLAGAVLALACRACNRLRQVRFDVTDQGEAPALQPAASPSQDNKLPLDERSLPTAQVRATNSWRYTPETDVHVTTIPGERGNALKLAALGAVPNTTPGPAAPSDTAPPAITASHTAATREALTDPAIINPAPMPVAPPPAAPPPVAPPPVAPMQAAPDSGRRASLASSPAYPSLRKTSPPPSGPGAPRPDITSPDLPAVGPVANPAPPEIPYPDKS